MTHLIDLKDSAYRIRYLENMVKGYREALAELAGAIPLDRSAGDSPLMQALAQANLVLKEGPQ